MKKPPVSKLPILLLPAVIACAEAGDAGPDAIVTLETPVPEGEMVAPLDLVGVWQREGSGEEILFDTMEGQVAAARRAPAQAPVLFLAAAVPAGAAHLVALQPMLLTYEDAPPQSWIAGFIPVRLEREAERLLFSHANPGALWQRLMASPDTLEHYVCDECRPGETTILLTDPTEVLWARLVPVLAEEDVFASPQTWTRTDRAPRSVLLEWFPELAEVTSSGEGQPRD